MNYLMNKNKKMLNKDTRENKNNLTYINSDKLLKNLKNLDNLFF